MRLFANEPGYDCRPSGPFRRFGASGRDPEPMARSVRLLHRPFLLACALVGVLGVMPVLGAEDDEPAPIGAPPAGNPPVAADPPVVDPPVDPPVVVDPPLVGDPPVADGPPASAIPPVALSNPTPEHQLKKRPPEPPPPGVSLPGWDLDHLSPDQQMPAPLPRPDPFPIRPILYRHDIRVASLDGRRAPLKRIPQWVDVIERRELQEWRPYDIGYLARRLPNVTVGDGGNPFLQLPIIRGLGGDRVKVLTDGVWPSVQTLGMQGATLSLWDPEATERVEVYHGPGVYLRAIDSPGGMINIVPRRPRMHGAFSGDFGFRSAYDSATNTFRNRIEADVGEGRVAVLGGVTYTTVDNRDTATGTLTPSDYKQVSADAALDYFVTPRSRIGLTTQYTRARDINAPAATGSAFADPEYERFFVGLTFTAVEVGEFFHGQRVSLSLDSILQDDDRSLIDSNSGLSSSDEITRANFHLEGRLQLLCGHDTWAELTVAFANLKRSETLICEPNPDPRPRDPDPDAGGQPKPITDPHTHAEIDNCDPVTRTYEAEELLISTLIEDQVHCDCWDQYLGLRADYVHIDDTRTNRDDDLFLIGGAAGYARHLDRRRSVYVNASAGWRRPSIFERTATEIIDGFTVFGNADLDPEFHGHLEAGLKSSYRDRFSLQAAIFGHFTAETIAPVTLAGGASQSLENRGDVLTYGAEVTAAWRPWHTKEGLELFSSLGTTQSDDTDLVADVPIHYRAGGRYSVPAPRGWVIRRWFAEVAGYGAAESRDGPRGGDAYTTADILFGMGLHLAPGRTGAINVGVTNLLDEAYTPPGAALPARGLSFFAGLELDI